MAIEPLGCRIPVGDDACQVLADDSIVSPGDDGSRTGMFCFRLLALGDVGDCPDEARG
jgi:hypothetical protein